MHQYIYLIFPRNSLHSQELLDSRTSIEAAETAHLGAAVGEIRLVVDGHVVDVDGTVIYVSKATANVPFLQSCKRSRERNEKT